MKTDPLDIKVLIVTSEWPRFSGDFSGIHVFDQIEQLRIGGIHVNVFSFSGKKNLFRYIMAIIEFWRLDKSEFDLVHAHHGQSGVVALSQRTLPVVVTFHGSDLQGVRDAAGNVTFQGRVLQFVCRMVARFADEVILVSDHLKAFIPIREYHVIPVGIDLKLFYSVPLIFARSKLGLSEYRHLVLFVGNPERTEKRFWLAHAAVERLKTELDVELIVANGVLHEIMPYYMNACDVLLITSSSEGSPAMVKEALACHLPIVSADVGDIREWIETIEGCVVCEDARPETVADGLLRVLSNKKRIHGSVAVQDLDERFLIQKVIQVYQQAIETSKAI